jgi:hypothetical protein
MGRFILGRNRSSTYRVDGEGDGNDNSDNIGDNISKQGLWVFFTLWLYGPALVCRVYHGVLNLLYRGDFAFLRGYSTSCMTVEVFVPGGLSIYMTGVCVPVGILNVLDRLSLYQRGHQSAWTGMIVTTVVINVHDQGSLFLQGFSTCMTWCDVNARMAQDATVTSDHMCATTTYVMWSGKHLSNASIFLSNIGKLWKR